MKFFLLTLLTSLIVCLAQQNAFLTPNGLGVPTPTVSSSPATKEYVDTLIGGIVYDMKNQMDAMQAEIDRLNCVDKTQIKSCADAAANGNCKSGLYNVTTDSMETFEVYCDLDSVNGPWMLILAYANPNLDVAYEELSGFPTFTERSLGDSSYGQSDWGQANSTNIAKFNPTAVRLYCKSSTVNRPLHVMYKDTTVLKYLFFNSGVYPTTALATTFIPFDDHAAELPSSNTAITVRDDPLNNHLVYVASNSHWNIAIGGRWECDDYGPIDGYNGNTLHYIWIK